MGSPVIFNGANAKFLTSGIIIPGSTSGLLTLKPAAATTSYTITLPSAAGAGAVSIDGSGNAAFGTLAIANGGTAVTSVTTAPTASSFAGWDANNNLSSNAFIPGWQTIVSSAGTTTLTVTSPEQTFISGNTTQTVVLPVTSTLVIGQKFTIINGSSGVVTLNSSGGTTIQAMASASKITATVLLITGTGITSWVWTYEATYNSLALTTIVETSLIVGTTTNDNAVAGYIGEYISASVLPGSFINSSGSGNYGDVTSIALTAGDWDVTGLVGYGGGTSVNYVAAGISTTTGNSATGLTEGDTLTYQLGPTVVSDAIPTIPNVRISIASTTTVYLKYRSGFSASPNIFGRISARRVR